MGRPTQSREGQDGTPLSNQYRLSHSPTQLSLQCKFLAEPSEADQLPLSSCYSPSFTTAPSRPTAPHKPSSKGATGELQRNQPTRGAVSAQRLLAVVGAEAVHRQGALQDYYACGLQRATLLPPAHGRVYGVRMAVGQSRRPAGSRGQDAGHRCVLTFKTAGWFSKDLHRIEGFIFDKKKKKQSFLYGKWTEFLRATDITSYEDYVKTNAHKFSSKKSDKKSEEAPASTSPAHAPHKVLRKLNTITSSFRMTTEAEAVVGPDGEDGEMHSSDEPEEGEGSYPRTDSTYSIDIPNSSTLWEVDPRPNNSSQYYHFTLFAMSLNETSEDLRRTLAPTDCRIRPDIRHLEIGDIDSAAAEKNRLEEKQRDARKSRKKTKIEWKSRWFEQGTNPFTRQEDWLYSGGYWDRNFEELDIF
ncbi:Oxysterol-binding protein-related protein 1 [Portunus trituberculatus]|uniref:Oxysterol-binding protein-related protein 1 n=1 Tax=Portunus trituberculatus TaxID=210409 RepID=A0A5B7DNS0_PORTR|nr:Oxysterol-binding protein-related protein 1 [Portunus trituberculatus]